MLKKYAVYWIGLILFALIILYYILWFNKPDRNDPNEIRNILNKSTDIIMWDTLEQLNSVSGSSLFLVKDQNNYLHFIMLDNSDLLLNSKIPLPDKEIRLENEKIEWSNQHIKPSNKYAYYGIVYDLNIAKLIVNKMDVPILKYDRYQVFFSTEKFDTPIRIEGYSKTGELIYKNYET